MIYITKVKKKRDRVEFLIPNLPNCRGCAPVPGASPKRKLVVGWRSLCGASERLAPYEIPRERDAPTAFF